LLLATVSSLPVVTVSIVPKENVFISLSFKN
jgi:hypothetical protein